MLVWWQRREEIIFEVDGLFKDLRTHSPGRFCVNVLQVLEGGSDGTLGWMDCPLRAKSPASWPYSAAPTQDDLNSTGVKVPEQLEGEPEVPHSSEVE